MQQEMKYLPVLLAFFGFGSFVTGMLGPPGGGPDGGPGGSPPPSGVFNTTNFGFRIVKEFQKTTFSCATNTPLNTITLEIKYDTTFAPPTAERLEVSGTSFTLKVTSEEQAKEVRCSAINPRPGAPPDHFTLGTLLVDPVDTQNLALTSQVGKTVVATYGSAVNLTCRVKSRGRINTPDITWVFFSRAGNRLFMEGKVRENCVPENEDTIMTSTLSLAKATQKEDGIYRCVATLGLQKSQKNIELNVTVSQKAVVTLQPSTPVINIKEGNKPLEVTCKWSPGSFPISVKWIRLSTSQTLETCDVTASSCLLEIQKPKESDKGKYRCEVKNSAGTSSQTVEVQVQVQVQLDKTVQVSRVAERGISVKLTCKVLKAKPNPSFKWEYQLHMCATNSQCQPNDKDWKSAVDKGTAVPKQGVLTTQSDFTTDGETSAFYRCVASNLQTTDTIVFTITRIERTQVAASGVSKTTVGIVAAAAVLVVVLAVMFVVCYKRRVKKRFAPYLEPNVYEMDPQKTILEQSSNLSYDPDWEFPKNRVKLEKVLGSGAFGEVWLAEATGILTFNARDKSSEAAKRREKIKKSRRFKLETSANTDFVNEQTKVAVKTLKTTASHSDYKDLASELKILIHIGSHQNIVNLLGACTTTGELYVILEYCKHGSLRDYLRKGKETFKPAWLKNEDGLAGPLNLTSMTTVAFQVAKGMEFLSSRKCVHRDLAARNVLISENYVMKIADFGLARDIVEDDMYLKRSNAKEPVKWMAFESLAESTYTTESDIWAYGVLLWEIFALGAMPYPGLKNEDIFLFLSAGRRMEAPEDCPEEIYTIMKHCWKKTPSQRISFHKISDSLESCLLIESGEDDPYLVFDNSPSEDIVEVQTTPPMKTKKESISSVVRGSIKRASKKMLPTNTLTTSKLSLVAGDSGDNQSNSSVENADQDDHKVSHILDP